MTAFQLDAVRAAALEATTDRDWAHAVLSFFGVPGAIPPGDFRRDLIRAAARADTYNLIRLAQGFPELAAAVQLAQQREDGIARLRRVAGLDPRPGCPDGGTCHHECPPTPTGPRPCFRVRMAGPLSGVYPLNVWPEAVRREHGATVIHLAGEGD